MHTKTLMCSRCDDERTGAGHRQGSIAEDTRTMASKRSKKGKKRRKALQRWWQRSATTRRPLSQIPPENADQVAMTTTGEILQLIRLHYEVEESEPLRALFARLRCLEYDASQTRWVWLYTAEARTLSFTNSRAADNVVLGEFVFK